MPKSVLSTDFNETKRTVKKMLHVGDRYLGKSTQVKKRRKLQCWACYCALANVRKVRVSSPFTRKKKACATEWPSQDRKRLNSGRAEARPSRACAREIYPWNKVRVRRRRLEKKGPPSRVAVVEQENIETVHAPKHIQAAGALCMDRVAVLWSVPTAHRPREVKGPMPSSNLNQPGNLHRVKSRVFERWSKTRRRRRVQAIHRLSDAKIEAWVDLNAGAATHPAPMTPNFSFFFLALALAFSGGIRTNAVAVPATPAVDWAPPYSNGRPLGDAGKSSTTKSNTSRNPASQLLQTSRPGSQRAAPATYPAGSPSVRGHLAIRFRTIQEDHGPRGPFFCVKDSAETKQSKNMPNAELKEDMPHQQLERRCGNLNAINQALACETRNSGLQALYETHK
ncbi:hypothetical protein B0H13DRAFT_2508665 [Mycena leptocephala]|nr:hypothetical protein B0H13DRAFT_2508665 [Mycena leptocephala]